MAEQDPFKLAIRCQSELEAMIDAAILDAFVGSKPKPRELGPFDRRLRLAIAMGVIDSKLEGSLRALARLRNDFAHGTIEHLTLARAKGLIDPALFPYEKNEAVSKEKRPLTWLRSALYVAFLELSLSIELASREREEAREARKELALRRLGRAQQNALVQALRKFERDSPSKPEAESSD